MKSNCHGPQDQCPQGAYRIKELIFKKKNTPCLYMSTSQKGHSAISKMNFRLKTLTEIMAMLMFRPVINL